MWAFFLVDRLSLHLLERWRTEKRWIRVEAGASAHTENQLVWTFSLEDTLLLHSRHVDAHLAPTSMPIADWDG